MKKVLVTGGLGFIGSNLIKLLLKKNYYVINIDKVSYSSNKYNLKEYDNNKNYKFSEYAKKIGNASEANFTIYDHICHIKSRVESLKNYLFKNKKNLNPRSAIFSLLNKLLKTFSPKPNFFAVSLSLSTPSFLATS